MRRSKQPSPASPPASASSAVMSTAPPSSGSSTTPPKRSPTWRSAMDSDEQFDRLARRDTELTTLAVRGRRRALELMVLLYLPTPFVVMKLNNDTSLVSVIPIALACLGGTSYSWAKWTRRPEDSQSVAFLGLDRKRRGTTYRSL